MDGNEWCAIVHVDFRPAYASREAFIAALQSGGISFEAGEALLREFVAGTEHSSETIEVAVLQQLHAGNHFEVVARYRSEAAYQAQLSTPVHLAYRAGIAAALGSPYEDRLHGARGEQIWPLAELGDAVVITQLEVQPPHLEEAQALLEELVAIQASDARLIGQVLLQRRYLPTNLEVVAVWSSHESFDEHIDTAEVRALRTQLEHLLVAPIDDRRYDVFAGHFTSP
jgi:quinol monooxygenase YgiN